MTLSSEDRREIDLALAEWLTKLGGADGDRYRASFHRWLDERVEHRSAYAAFRATDHDVELTSLPTPPLHDRVGLARTPYLVQLALAATVLLAIGSAGTWAWQHHINTAASGTTQIAADDAARAIDLPDGRHVMLDAHAVLLTSLEDDPSTLTLLEGRSRFRLPEGSARFVVAAGNLRLTAHGAVFDVIVDDNGVRITSLGGTLVVRHQGGLPARPDMILKQGEQLVANRTGDRVTAAAPDEAGWTSALLPLDGKTLADIIAIGNRHGGKPIMLADPALSARMVQGQLPATDTHILALQLAAAFDLDLHETKHGYVLAIKT